MRKLKVQKLKDKYGLNNIDEELERRYVDEDQSLRDLAEYINKRISREYFKGKPFSGEYVYQAFNDTDAISRQGELDLKKRLQTSDVDIDELERDWVGHIPVKSYLNRVLDITTSRDDMKKGSGEILSDIRGAIEHNETIVKELLKRIDDIDMSKWDLYTDIRLRNIETGESIRLEDRLREQEKQDD